MHFEKNLPATQTRSYLRVWTGLKTNKGLCWRAAGELPASRAQLRDRRRVGIAEAVELGGVEELGNHGSGRNILPQSGQAHRSFHVLLNQCPLMLMLTPVLLGAHRGFGHYTWLVKSDSRHSYWEHSLEAQIVVAFIFRHITIIPKLVSNSSLILLPQNPKH